MASSSLSIPRAATSCPKMSAVTASAKSKTGGSANTEKYARAAAAVPQRSLTKSRRAVWIMSMCDLAGFESLDFLLQNCLQTSCQSHLNCSGL